MSRKWSQQFVLNPFTNIRANDILNLTRQGSPDTSGAGELGVMTSRYTQINVNNAGNDTTGNGSLLAPFKTVQGAINYIAALGDASVDKQYIISMTGEITDASAELIPFVHLVSDGSPWRVSAITVSSSFNTADLNTVWYQNLSIAADCNIDLTFADGVGSGRGRINFVNFKTCRVNSNPSPVININIGSAQNNHIFNFYNPMFDFNDGSNVTIACDAVIGNAFVTVIGGIAPANIDFSNASGADNYIVLNGVAASSSGCNVYVNNTSLYSQNIMSSFGLFSFHVDSNSNVYYDSSINDPMSVISESGSGNSFHPLTDSITVAANYSPSNFSYPSPLAFGTEPTVNDAIKGIDDALAIVGNTYPPGYINGFALMGTGFTTVLTDPGNCLNHNGTYNIIATGQLTCDLSASGAGGLDTGSAAAGTPYALYVIAKSSVVGGAPALVFSTNFLTPNLSFDPTYDRYRYIGRVRTITGAAQLCAFTCVGNSNDRTYYITTTDSAAHVLTGGTATTPTNLTTTAWTNINYTRAIGFMYVLNCGNSTTTSATLTSNGFAGNPFWTRVQGNATGVTETNSTGLMPINDNGSILAYQFSSASTGRTLDLYVNMIQEFI